MLGGFFCGELHERAVHRAGVFKAKQNFKVRHGDQWLAWRRAQAFRSGAAIGANQAARAEFDAAVPARHDDGDSIEALAVDGRQNGATCGAGGLAIIIEAIFAVQTPSPTVVRGVGIADFLEKCQRLFWRCHGHGLCDEATVFDLDFVSDFRRERVHAFDLQYLRQFYRAGTYPDVLGISVIVRAGK